MSVTRYAVGCFDKEEDSVESIVNYINEYEGLNLYHTVEEVKNKIKGYEEFSAKVGRKGQCFYKVLEITFKKI